MSSSGLVAAWEASDLLSIATSHDSLIAMAHGSSVAVVRVDNASGEVVPMHTLRYSQQVSAIALLEQPRDTMQVRFFCTLAALYLACVCQLLKHMRLEGLACVDHLSG